jgi:hypothetical protein
MKAVLHATVGGLGEARKIGNMAPDLGGALPIGMESAL